MVSISAQGKLHAKESDTQLEHTIFQICLQCHYNTLRPLDCAPITTCGPGYRCPECQKSSFVTACTKCRFESSVECPLTQLLNRRPKAVTHDRRGPERYRKGDHGEGHRDSSASRGPGVRRPDLCQSGSLDAPDMKKQCQDILKQFKKNGNKVHTAPQEKRPVPHPQPKSPPKPSTPPPRTTPPRPEITGSEPHASSSSKPTKASQPPAPPKEVPAPAETPRVFCTQCSQARCSTCKPGYMNLVVDMKEFSITFASETALCTMCEHWLCPGSSLVVLYRCRDCGHEGCDGCATHDDGLGEEWVICCCCAKMKGGNEVAVAGL
jgi:hypothetical protein